MEKQKAPVWGGVLVAVLLVLGVVTGISAVIYAEDTLDVILAIVSLALYAVQIFFVLHDYKRPHSNTFRITVVLFAWVLMAMSLHLLYVHMETMPFDICLLAAAALSVSYISGRLNKFKFCSVQMTVISVLLLVSIVYNLLTVDVSGFETLAYVFPEIQWLAMDAIYHYRYREHIAAGRE